MKDRRDFLKTLAVVATAAGGANPAIGSVLERRQAGIHNAPGLTVLFQGDSITDGNRTRNNDWNHVMGHGYAYTIASRLWYEHPDKGFHFFNRGVSGNRITHLAERWQTDTLDLKPDILSILVGINDTAAFIRGDATCTGEQFETGYRELLHRTRKQLPGIRFVLCQPFILPVGKVRDNWEVYQKEVVLRQKITERLASEFQAIHVPFQGAFDATLTKAPADYWIWDGIHPMPAGHELMARFWIEKVSAQMGI